MNPNRRRALRLLVGGLLAGLAAGVVVSLGFWVGRGPASALAAVVTMLVVIGFFAVGQGLQAAVADASPRVGLVVALGSYAVRVTLLGVVVLGSLGGPDRVSGADPVAVVVATIAVTIGWVSGEVAAYHRLRIPVFDSLEGSPPTAAPR